MNSKIRKAIIPAAGLGTRFLPATKTIPKEMLTVVDAPIIMYVVEEALEAGIEDIVLIAGRGKHAIEDFFDTSYELEDKLAKSGKTDLLKRLSKIRDSANIISIRQKQPQGLGHAVLCAEPVLGQEPFAVLLGDEIMYAEPGEPKATQTLCEASQELQSSVVAVMKVDSEDVSKYGIAEVGVKVERPSGASVYDVKSFVEKPKPEETDSRWALPGRYVFSPEILSLLKEAKPGLAGEIQLTDAMAQLCEKQKVWASTFSCTRHDAGDKLGYLQANIEIALTRSDLAPALKKYMKQVLAR